MNRSIILRWIIQCGRKNPKHKFKPKRGFLFRQDYLFKDYVQNLYELRISSPKISPINIIAKLLLNSLYGRFGMKDLEWILKK